MGAGDARRVLTNSTLRDAYVRAAEVSADVGLVVRVVYEIWEPVAALNAAAGIPSSAASAAAPLDE